MLRKNTTPPATHVPGQISRKALLRCFFRSHLINAAYNSKGVQSSAFLYALQPGLMELYPERQEFNMACDRYASFFNCHPFWAPYLVGVILHLEQAWAQGKINGELLKRMFRPALNSLSGIGDSFFSGSLYVTAVLSLLCLVLLGSPLAATTLALCIVIIPQLFKFAIFIAGWRKGFGIVPRLRRLNLPNKADYVKMINAVFLTCLLCLALLPVVNILEPHSIKEVCIIWVAPLLSLALSSYLVLKLHISRSLLLAILVAIFCLGQLLQ